MADLSTQYLGFDLKSPLIVGSCGLTSSVAKIRDLAENGAGAVVLKSLFEEQILGEVNLNLDDYTADHPDAIDSIREYTRDSAVEKYLSLISDAKKAVDIPIIASINCVSGDEWVSFASKIEQAGADSIELNVSMLPTNPRTSCLEAEETYRSVVDKVSKAVSVPLALKMSYFSSGLAHLITDLGWKKGVDAFVLFNRYYRPDIDIEKMSFAASYVRGTPSVIHESILSTPDEIYESLRWITLLASRVDKDFIAGTGVHDSEGVIKQILAGATGVQLVSSLYKHGTSHLGTILQGVEEWMEKKSFTRLSDFRGKLGYTELEDPSVFERTQFMKYYGGI